MGWPTSEGAARWRRDTTLRTVAPQLRTDAPEILDRHHLPLRPTHFDLQLGILQHDVLGALLVIVDLGTAKALEEPVQEPHGKRQGCRGRRGSPGVCRA